MTDPSSIIGMCPYPSLMADLWSQSSSISLSLLMRVTSSFFPNSALQFSRLLYFPKFIFIFLLLFLTLSLCPLSAAPVLPEDDQLKQFHPCSSHCNRGLHWFCGIPNFPSPNRKMSPFPMTQICRGNVSIILNILYHIFRMMTKGLNVPSWLKNVFLTDTVHSSCKETLHENGQIS